MKAECYFSMPVRQSKNTVYIISQKLKLLFHCNFKTFTHNFCTLLYSTFDRCIFFFAAFGCFAFALLRNISTQINSYLKNYAQKFHQTFRKFVQTALIAAPAHSFEHDRIAIPEVNVEDEVRCTVSMQV